MSFLRKCTPAWISSVLMIIASTGRCTDSFLLEHALDRASHHSCNGDCGSPSHHLPFLRERLHGSEQVGLTDVAIFEGTETSDAWGLSNTETPMQVIVRTADGSSPFASGVSRFAKVEYGPLNFELLLPASIEPVETRLIFDGHAAHPELLKSGDEWSLDENGWRRTFQWECPPLGRHTLQFETRIGNRVVVSQALMIEIVAPLKPEVVAVGSEISGTQPIKSGQIVEVFQDRLVVKFAMPATEGMQMKTSHLESIPGEALGNCCFAFDLQGQFTIGRHALQFCRVVGTDCGMTSELSNKLWIQYEPTQVLKSIRNENAENRRALAIHTRTLTNRNYITEASGLLMQRLDNPQSYFAQADVPSPKAEVGGEQKAVEIQEAKTRVAELKAAEQKVAELRASSQRAAEHLAKAVIVADNKAGQINVEETSTLEIEAKISEKDRTINEMKASKKEDAEIEKVNQEKVSLNAQLDIAREKIKKFRIEQNELDKLRTSLTKLVQLKSVELEEAENKVSYLVWKTKMDNGSTLDALASVSASDLDAFENNLGHSESVWQADKVVSHTVFDAPAYFSKNGYGTAAQEDARVGLVLLEGMELSTKANGHWTLKIPYIQPISPAELFLQIQFKTADGQWKPLTLRPVCFEAGKPCIKTNDDEANAQCSCENNGPYFILRGYSPILHREVGYFTDVRRRGSVTFGHGFSALEDRRQF